MAVEFPRTSWNRSSTVSQQVDASDARQKGGTGLGLAICRTIVMQHGGRIWAERNADRGSTFRMFLPSVMREMRDLTARAVRSESFLPW